MQKKHIIHLYLFIGLKLNTIKLMVDTSKELYKHIYTIWHPRSYQEEEKKIKHKEKLIYTLKITTTFLSFVLWVNG